MRQSAAVPILMRVPPPLLFVAAFLAGVAMQRVMPLSLHFKTAIDALHLLGAGMLAIAGLFALSCVGMFLWARTTVLPFATAAKLVTVGPYRCSRNPMYVSLVLAHLGAAELLVQAWPLAVLPLPVLVLGTVVIPFEEARLRDVFGEDFEHYCARVRRWI